MAASIEEQATVIATRFLDGPAAAQLAQAILAFARELTAPIVRGPLVIDPARRAVHFEERPVALLAREYALLVELARTPDPVDRPTIRARVLHRNFDPGTNAVEVHIHRLRAKLGRATIETVPRIGYRLALPV